MPTGDFESTYKQEFPVLPESAIHTSVLKAVPMQVSNEVYLHSELVSEELTSLCPWSGLPDYAIITISYVPKATVVEFKSLKLYLASFHFVGIKQEDIAQRICRDLGKLTDPVSLSVKLAFKVRGGIAHSVEAVWIPLAE